MESLILGIIGDIVGYDYKKDRLPITRKKHGDSFINKGMYKSFDNFNEFIHRGGITKYYGNYPYSFPTMILFATMKGISKDKENSHKGCKKEYMKLYEKYKNSKFTQSRYINYTNKHSLAELKNINTIANNDPNDESFNDAMAIVRAIPYGLLYYKKNERKKLVTEIIQNIQLTHNNITCYLSAVGLGLFLSFGRNNIRIEEWADNLIDYLLTNEFDNIIKDMKLYSTEFIIAKEDFISLCKEIDLNVKNLYKNKGFLEDPINRSLIWYRIFENASKDEFMYGIRADHCLEIAYITLIISNENWQNVFVNGILGITDNAVMGMICGALYGCQYKFENVWIQKYVNEEWLKKSIKLGKSLGL